MVRFLIFAAVVSVALTIYTLIECARAERSRIRSLPKPAWFAVIILLPLVGAGLWFLLGRPAASHDAPAQKSMAPDDDEDFLRQLEIWRRQQQREADLKAREQDLTKREEAQKADDAKPAKPEAKEPKPSAEHENNPEGSDSASPDSE
ncbi:PLD nuclease N-terminal domain-containing protein [Glutamicibacter nicotianae]|uniref:PLD nuclease N-terminal domain-containing protein n=1 Tax=Glutamicibacter nicotianae TaxID=37929 RepID=UPI00167F54B5|nr:PLD nuclease N-terminal domain-containing protein [Glutamicibacter nicotianae]